MVDDLPVNAGVNFFIRSVNINDIFMFDQVLNDKGCHIKADDMRIRDKHADRCDLIVDIEIFSPG